MNIEILINNYLQVKSYDEALLKIPLTVVALIIIALSPVLIAFTGAFISEYLTGEKCLNEGSCFWMTIPWLCLLSLPGCFVALVYYLVVTVQQITKLRSKH